MIVSASRRTDIPAYYADWFMNRMREGYCVVHNPYNPKQATRVSLLPDDVDAFVFWSKNPRPLIEHLPELDRIGYRYYFLFTLNDYPAGLEQNLPSVEERLQTFRELAGMLGEQRVIWRYDPIIVSNKTDYEWHAKKFGSLCDALDGCTQRVFTSFATYYRKTTRNLRPLESDGYLFDTTAGESEEGRALLKRMAETATRCGMRIFSCAQDEDYAAAGVTAGRCIDPDLLNDLWQLSLPYKKDPGQRTECLCTVSRDIGATDSCLHHCPYCYATANRTRAEERFKRHDPSLPAMIDMTVRDEP